MVKLRILGRVPLHVKEDELRILWSGEGVKNREEIPRLLRT